MTGATVTSLHQRGWFAGLLVLPAMVLVGCSGEAPPAASAELPKVTVAHPVSREEHDYEPFNGYLQPDKTQEVRARVRGQIQKVDFHDGDLVKKGELLFEIDPRPFQAALDAAKAQMAAAEAALELARAEYQRNFRLLQTGSASREEVEVWKAKQSVAVADRLKAKAEIERAELDLEYSRITADIAGRIGKAELTEGNLVNAGGSDPLLTTISAVDPMRLYFNVDERSLVGYAKQLGAQGKNVTELLAALKDAKTDFTFALETDTEYKHRGHLAFGNNRIDPGTGTIQLYGIVDNKNGFYLPGARVRIRLPVGKPYEALLVPDTAVLTDQDKKYLLVVEDKDGKKVVQRRDVTPGRLRDDGMRILLQGAKGSGVTASDRVIVEGLQRARINYPVDPVEAASRPDK
jgi:multidrug efflux system membrane fusion protein